MLTGPLICIMIIYTLEVMVHSLFVTRRDSVALLFEWSTKSNAFANWLFMRSELDFFGVMKHFDLVKVLKFAFTRIILQERARRIFRKNCWLWLTVFVADEDVSILTFEFLFSLIIVNDSMVVYFNCTVLFLRSENFFDFYLHLQKKKKRKKNLKLKCIRDL